MSLEPFSALDFETATWNPASVCQVGIVRFEDGKVVEKINRLIQPPKNEYFYKNIEIHGIKPENTLDAPLFEEVWFDFKHLIEDQVVVAHNANFDVNCLRSSLAFYDIAQPDFEVRCTRVIYRRGLAYLSKKYKIPLTHHNAYSDAFACGQLYLMHLKRQALPKTGTLF
ncbi:exonuclease domain-containing protein [Ekhidna sp.]|uniref:exonuclease domain-containing protein n=1 Tax=Ekhidna sp. TaxID=2608089 RepID=UPI003B5AF14B